MFSAALWIPEKAMFLVVSRIFSAEKNSFAYAAFFDVNWRQVMTPQKFKTVTVPGILPITLTNYVAVYAGPEDSRLIQIANGDILCVFNMRDDQDEKRKMWIFNFSTGKTTRLLVSKYFTPGSKQPKIPIAEKNWCPLVVDDRLYMIYNFKNFQLVDCTNWDAPCRWIQGKFDSSPGGLRGGTPFVRFRNLPYYFSIAYTHIKHPTKKCDVYRPTIAVVHTPNPKDPTTFKLIYTGNVMNFNNLVFLSPITDLKSVHDLHVCGLGRILTVPSIAKCDFEADKMTLSVNIDDSYNLIVNLGGITSFLDSVIKLNENGMLQSNENCAEYFSFDYFDKNRV